jgi:N-formylmaleamate deformylase
MENIESAFVKCNGTSIHYYRRRALALDSAIVRSQVLIHGISDDGFCWSPFLSSMNPAWDVVMPDLRGHGLSEDPDEGWNIIDIAAEITGLVQELGMIKPFMAGASLGGAVVLALAAENPGVPAAIFLEDPVPFWNAPNPLPEDVGRGLRSWLSGLKRKTYSDLKKDVESASWSPEEHDPWIDSKHRMSAKAIQLAINKNFASSRLASLLGRIRCPVFIISGEISRGALCRDDDIAALKKVVPQLQFLRVRAAGHNVRRENPITYADAFMSFFGL